MSRPRSPRDALDVSSHLSDLSLSTPQAARPIRSQPSSTAGHAVPASRGLLQDEDMSLAFGPDEDDSFGFERGPDGEGDGDATARFAPPVPPTRNGATDDETLKVGKDVRQGGPGNSNDAMFFAGSMAASTSAATMGRTDDARPSALGQPRIYADHDSRRGGAREDPTEMDVETALAAERDSELVAEDEFLASTEFTDLPEDERNRIRQLRSEREELRGMNKVLQQVIKSLRITEGNMVHLADAATTSHELLDLYSRIASQAEHTKDLILDTEWQGAAHDIDVVLAREAAAREQEEADRLRLEAEEAERVERARREADERTRRDRERETSERRRPESATARGGGGVGARGGLRGRGRASASTSSTSSTRGRTPTTSSSSRDPNQSISSISTTSGIPTFSGGSNGSRGGAGRGSAPVSGVRGVRGLRSRVAVSGRGSSTGPGAARGRGNGL
ncbi:hypothetical protein JCM10212_003065 [Sporobolomyces blumeae]